MVKTLKKLTSTNGDQWAAAKSLCEKDLPSYSTYVNIWRRTVQSCYRKQEELTKKANKADSWISHGIDSVIKPMKALTEAVKKLLPPEKATVVDTDLNKISTFINEQVVNGRKKAAEEFDPVKEASEKLKAALAPFHSSVQGQVNSGRIAALLLTHVTVLDILTGLQNKYKATVSNHSESMATAPTPSSSTSSSVANDNVNNGRI